MPARLVFLFFALIALVLPAAGCEIATLGGPRLVTMEVGPKLADCTGVGPRKCMMVRREGQQEWQLFYSGIEGFEYEEGF
ncbi:MAG TPA: DUF4377 domain-containing protein, partial [Longimicrobiaceae bacterium]